jgi:hypothetical protein
MIRVVNAIPQPQSGEVSSDAEPTVAVDPARPRTIVVTSTATVPAPNAAGVNHGQLFVSHDGGWTWGSDPVVPTAGVADITIDYAGIVGAGWRLSAQDINAPLHLHGDGADELVVVSPDGQWIGVLEGSGAGLAVAWIGHDWVNSPGHTGAEGWNLNQGDHFVVADIDGDGADELVVVSPDGQWIGVLEGSGAGLAVAWIGHDWVQPNSPQSTLLAGALDPITASTDPITYNLLRTFDVDDAAPMTSIEKSVGGGALSGRDQPWLVETAIGSEFRAFVGFNDVDHGTQTASVQICRRPNEGRPTLSIARLERRNPAQQDGPSIRIAAHPDGHVYAAFMSWTTQGATTAGVTPLTVDVVMTRDDRGGASPDPFGALVDPGDHIAGVRVASGVSIRFTRAPGLGGTDRIGSDLATAVDPTNSAIVYLAWCDDQTIAPATTPTYTLHLRRSTDSGATWGNADILTLGRARNPGVAVNALGTVGFMYQQFTPAGALGGIGTWATHFQRGTQQGTNWTDFILANAPATGWQGDYLQLKALDRAFYGVFSADNTPLTANFPQGVRYGRNATFATGTLLALNNLTPVGTSIDPYFVKVTEPPDDARVRITCRALDSDRIAKVGGPLPNGGTWTLPVEDVIARIEDDHQEFFVRGPSGAEVDVIVALGPRGRKYIRTIADATTADNLDSLPDCP